MVKIIFDAALIYFSFIFAYYLRFYSPMTVYYPTTHMIFRNYSETLLIVVVLWMAIFKLVGMYDEKRSQVLIDELALLVFSVLIAALTLLGFLFLYRGLWFSRLVVVNASVIAVLLLAIERTMILFVSRWIKSLGFGRKRVLIVGSGEMGQTLARRLKIDRMLGADPVGYIDADRSRVGQVLGETKIVGALPQIKETIRDLSVNEVVFASNDLPYQQILDIITECEVLKVSFKIVPGILEIIASRVNIEEVGGIPLVTVREIGLKGFNAFLKRTIDAIAAGALLLSLSPVFVLISALIKLDSRGPVFFFQDRVGKDGKNFKMYKFRSMISGAEEMIGELEKYSEAEGHLFKIKKDPRMTRVGKWLRRLSIDEWPQLFNVIKGDMSLVGPRPPLPREVEKYSPWHMKRLRISPGITGLWQVSGRSLLPFEDMVRLDIYYIENWSLWLDVKILFRTIPVVLTAFGAY